ncbi:uncharacterized protein LOC126894649 [Daktulosphaira vitifoliae]|uniref:uncharacterized protein LOC126894649 n=1 Tax=Daktulosphaira vitifoliae TaxID=58002 RepID=UPI0021A98DEE|nr:uncharacterized protein LOC126894649 [Daktulosphaira vitifoliae]XP_050521772.1 uncharacterized protein LOC126894649 [Daktulosphaira vitifoliae]
MDTNDEKSKEVYSENQSLRPKLKYTFSYNPSMARSLDFVVKGPTPIIVHKKQKILSGCSYIELKLQKNSKISEMTFRNYYTSSISVLVLRSNTQSILMGSRNWEVAIKNKILMKYPNFENGAQDYFSIFTTEVWHNVSKIKIILRQPSPLCKTFHLEEIKVYSDVLRFAKPFCEQKLPSFLIHNTQEAINFKASSKMNESYKANLNKFFKPKSYNTEQVDNT